MGRFEDQLWADLMTEHGDTLATERRTPPRRARPATLGAVGVVGTAGLATALALTLTATGAGPAYAVSQNADGSVTVTINQIEGVSGANAKLTVLGVRARAVAVDPHCAVAPTVSRPHFFDEYAVNSGPGQNTLTIEPEDIPADDTLVLVAEQVNGRTALAVLMVGDPAPACFSSPHIKSGFGGATASPTLTPSASH